MYTARITRHNPTAFIFLIDQSGSMEEKMQFGQSYTTKAEMVAKVTNMLIRELINRCRKEEGIMDYFDIAAIGYSSDNASMLLGTKESFVKPSVLNAMECKKRIFTHEREFPDGTVNIVSDELKYWIEPQASGNTPMRSAFELALQLTSRWCRKQSNCDSYPPTIFNITDGEATDSDSDSLISIAEQLKNLSTNDGNTLLININITSTTTDKRILFPESKNVLPLCRYAEMLYDMSSVMPDTYTDAILKIRNESNPPYRGMSLNTTAADLIAMMDIGSQSITRII